MATNAVNIVIENTQYLDAVQQAFCKFAKNNYTFSYSLKSALESPAALKQISRVQFGPMEIRKEHQVLGAICSSIFNNFSLLINFVAYATNIMSYNLFDKSSFN